MCFSYDILRVFDGGNLTEPLLDVLSGTIESLTEIQSTGNELYLRFESDPSHNKPGFQIEFQEGV